MRWIKLFEDYSEETITLYHGTCKENAISLIENGWQPKEGYIGANQGQSKYLYLTTEPEDAMWFAEEKGCDTVVKIENIPLSFLRPDPEDEAGYSMSDLLDRIKNTPFPAKFALLKALSSDYFSLL